jgi:hypothetical protein
MLMGGTILQLAFRFTHPEALMGHRVQVLAWTRPHGTALAGAVHWDVRGAKANVLVGSITLLPTGRRTDDGWVEISSGPVDFYLGGRVEPVVEFLDTQYFQYDMETGYPTANFDSTARAELDALEIDDLGPSLVPDAVCKVSTEDTDCGGLGRCYYGRCVDFVAVKGSAPQGTLRDEYLARRQFEFENFTGIRAMDAVMTDFEAAMAALKTAPDKSFWIGLMEAWNLGRDPHGAPPIMNYLNEPAVIGMCTHLGAADLLPADASGKTVVAPLLFSVDTTFAPYAALQPGDALTAIDGMPVDQWKQQNKRLFYTQGDPRADAVISSPEIPLAAAKVGAVLTFSRCPASIGATRACTADEVVSVKLDMRSAYGADLWAGFEVNWGDYGPACDWRFLRLPSTDVMGDYMHTAAGDDGDVRTLEINGVPPEDDPASARWVTTVDGALQPDKSKFILDERQGDGGSFDAVLDIASRLLPATPVLSTGTYPRLQRPLDLATANRFIACSDSGGGDPCGLAINTVMAGAAAGTLKDARLAILTSMDVSGNDFVTRFLTSQNRTGPTRIFGPGPTEGGYGYIIISGSHLNEMMGGSFQISDSDFRTGDLTAAPVLESLTGVSPDQVVLQTQSDILAGKDTLVETAKAWLRQP